MNIFRSLMIIMIAASTPQMCAMKALQDKQDVIAKKQLEKSQEEQLMRNCSLGDVYLYADRPINRERPTKIQIIYVKNDPVGFIEYIDFTSPTRHIELIFIKQDMRGKHIGKIGLLQFITQSEQEGVNFMTLSARKPNLIPFYEKLGFKSTSTTHKEFMEKGLKHPMKKQLEHANPHTLKEVKGELKLGEKFPQLVSASWD